ncbi:MAG TPA: hypothetical protein VGX96_09775 [Candidatus Elarobacter sp.]|jgi:hypothetical protein|nr:hypothetical protein [Candidatus Elarobacter sp.]
MATDVDALHAELSEGYGFRVPQALALAIAACEGRPVYDAFTLSWLYEPSRPWARFRNIDPGYTGLVPDLFIVASPGVDGIQYGFVLHAPELDIEPLPIFEFDPVYGTVSFYARDVREMLLRGAAWSATHAAESGDPYDTETYGRVASALDLPSIPPVSRNDELIAYQPPVPPGWRYVPTDDTIGVLAPEIGFGREDVDVDSFRVRYLRGPEIDMEIRRSGGDPLAGADVMAASLLDDCRHVLAAGFPGTALVGIRRLYRALGDSGGISEAQNAAVFDVWTAVYEALGRPVLADAARRLRDDVARRAHASSRWVAAWETFERYPEEKRRRVHELAGPMPAGLRDVYKLRFADAIDQVEREF